MRSGPITQLMSNDMESMDEKWWRATKEVRRVDSEADGGGAFKAAAAVGETMAPSCDDDDMLSSGRGVAALPSVVRRLSLRFSMIQIRSYRTRASGGYIIMMRPAAIG